MKNGNYIRTLNYILVVILVALWGSVFLLHGMIGAVAWSLAILLLAPVGLVISLATFITLIVFTIKKKKKTAISLALLLSLILAFPVLILLNIIHFAYPVNIGKVQPSVTASWPLKEKTTVGWGGDSVKTNAQHAVWPSERWAYDLVIEPADMGSSNLWDYGIYNKDVVAPVSGIVVEAYDKEDDIMPNSEEFKSMEGNHIYIRIDETQTYLLVNHLKKDSVLVKAGAHVKEGEIIGKVGNSGSTSEPHLHIHHQRQDPTKTIYPVFAEGLPLYFRNIVGDSMPEKGEVIIPQ